MEFDETEQLERALEKAKLSPDEKREVKRRWRLSLWRILPLPVISYTIVGTYLWMVGTPDAWQRAAAPVIAILTFTTLAPFIRKEWFRRTRAKIQQQGLASKAREAGTNE